METNQKQITEVDWDQLKLSIENLIVSQNMIFGWYNDEELKRTPERILQFYKEWINSNNFNFTTFKVEDRDQMITFNDITFFSMCSHHFLPFFGKVHIAYLPDRLVGGASKFPRIVKKYSSKPTTQEILTAEIADNINEVLNPRFLFVRIEARHLCQEMRGIRSIGEIMKTSSLRYVKSMENMLVHLKEEARQ
jgi:GTP cyclohydrolase I